MPGRRFLENWDTRPPNSPRLSYQWESQGPLAVPLQCNLQWRRFGSACIDGEPRIRTSMSFVHTMSLSLIFALFGVWQTHAVALDIKGPITTAVSVQPSDLLVKPPAENWPSYNGDYTGRRYSALDQINPSNVDHLRAQWVFHSR